MVKLEEAKMKKILEIAKSEAEKCSLKIFEQESRLLKKSLHQDTTELISKSMINSSSNKSDIGLMNDDVDKVSELFHDFLNTDEKVVSSIKSLVQSKVSEIFREAPMPKKWLKEIESSFSSLKRLKNRDQTVEEEEEEDDDDDDFKPSAPQQPVTLVVSPPPPSLQLLKSMQLTISELRSELKQEKLIRRSLENRLHKLESYVDFDGKEWEKTKGSISPFNENFDAHEELDLDSNSSAAFNNINFDTYNSDQHADAKNDVKHVKPIALQFQQQNQSMFGKKLTEGIFPPFKTSSSS
jgi:hypothetical protein